MFYRIGNNYYNSSYLSHHGILGQKWGKRNGPPYPLDSKDHSSAEKKAMRYGSRSTAYTFKKTKRIKATKVESTKGSSENGKAIREDVIRIAKENGFRVKDRSSSVAEDCKPINPKYDPKDPNGHYSTNCLYCSMAYSLRRMGLDVKVKDDGTDWGSIDDVPKYFKNTSEQLVVDPNIFERFSQEKFKKTIVKECSKKIGMPDGSFGLIGVSSIDYSFGHMFSWEYSNGEFIVCDPQSGSIKDAEETIGLTRFGLYSPSIRIIRMDNSIPNGELLKEQFENV